MFALPLSIALYVTAFIFGIKILKYTHGGSKRVRKVRLFYFTGFITIFILFIIWSFSLYDSGNVDTRLAVFFIWLWFFPSFMSIMGILQWIFIRRK